MYKIGGGTPAWFDYLFDTATNEYEDEEPFDVDEFDLNALMPGRASYYHYDGSLVRSCTRTFARSGCHVGACVAACDAARSICGSGAGVGGLA